MSVKEKPENCPKFTLVLKGGTSKKRLLEAKQDLESLYPFPTDKKNILIFKTNKKGTYDVYIAKEEIKNERDIRKICLIILSCVLLITVLIFQIHHAALKASESLKMQKEFEKQKEEETKLLTEKKKNLVALKKEYDEKKNQEYEKIYPYLERIYSVMKENTTIESISIQNDNFTIEVTTKDALGILSKFEISPAFTSVKMNRTNVKNKIETVTYSGKFSRFKKEAVEDSSIDDKIMFYKTELTRIYDRSKAMQNVTLSEYINKIRKLMHKNSCSEQYIQLKENKKDAEVEFFVLSASKNILNFIKEIQNEDENLIDIKSFALRNSENPERLQTTICFETGIQLMENDQMISEYTGKKTEPSKINTLFYKTPSVNKSPLKTIETKNNISISKTDGPSAPVQIKKLSYIGITKTDGRDFVIAKDEEMENIYKLELTQTEMNKDFCIQREGGYRAKIRGEYYEVIKK